jgi:agmatinase
VLPPRPHPFLAAEAGEPRGDASALIAGFACDGGVSFRPGAALGPEGVRRFSDSIESYSPRTGRDLDDLPVIDLGDHEGSPPQAEAVVDGILDAAWSASARPLLVGIGGDHSVTPPIVRAVRRRMERPALIGFDAHLDLREDYPGDHACTYRRVADAGVDCFVLGPRSGARHEWEDAERVLAYCSGSLHLPGHVRAQLENRDVYVTIDIDVLDPSAAPGTGNPEPGGPGFEPLLSAIEALEGLRVVALDVVEVSPPLDPSGITQAAAAVLIREAILRFAPA